MSDQPPFGQSPQPDDFEPQSLGDAGQFTQRIRNQQVAARVPESVGRGTYATGALILHGPHEFTIDFIQTITRPHQVNARIILSPNILPRLIDALRQNLDTFIQRFGPPAELPKPVPPVKPPSVQEIYEHLKLTDEIAAGVYANTVLITHAPAEFCFDFISSLYPRSTVNSRIFMAAPQVPRLLTTLTQSFDQFQRRQSPASPPHHPPQPPSPPQPPHPPQPPTFPGP
jgi:hypothetical protein